MPSMTLRFSSRAVARLGLSLALFILSTVGSLLSTVGSLSLAAHAQPSQPEPPTFSQLVVFGDSLSDVGNVSQRVRSALGVRYPGPAFNFAGGRFTNGPSTSPASARYVGVWHEQLAQALGLPAATASLEGGQDFAFGAATTQGGLTTFAVDTAQVGIDNMGLQVDTYLSHNTPEPHELTILWGGTNDLFADSGAPNATSAAQRVGVLVQKLARAGARTFLVLNAPPLGDTPRAAAEGSQGALNQASAAFRSALSASLDQAQASLSAQNDPITIYRLDVFDLFRQVKANPAAYGLANIAERSQGEAVDPDSYLFWDYLHPTVAGHHQIAVAAQALLSRSVAPAPTPSPTPSLSLSLSRTTLGESSGALAATATISRSGPASTPLTISLSSSDTGEALVPPSVTIRQGARSATFAVSAVDDALADGPQQVTISARATSYKSADAVLTVTDNEAPALSLSLSSARVREGSGRGAVLTIRRNTEVTASSRALVVTLSANVPGQIALPHAATIPSRATSIAVPIVAFDDALPDGPRRVVITARTVGFAPASQPLTAEDNEAASRFSIAGRIQSAGASGGASTPVPQVLVSLRVGAVVYDEVLSDSAGNFRFSGLPAAAYTIAVSKAGLSFTPPARSVRLASSSVAGVTFVASARH